MTYVSEDYIKAYKMGKKDYQARMMRGEVPTLKVLDDILPSRGSYSEVPLGLVQIPIDQIVGTKSGGRSSAFPEISCRSSGKTRSLPTNGVY
mgnify:CR=1 FL=1